MQELLQHLLLLITITFGGVDYTHGVLGSPNTFHVTQAAEDAEKSVSQLIYRGLLRYDENDELQNDLAQEVLLSEDKRTYRVRIEQDTFFSNGVPITTDDVIYTYSQRDEFSDVVMQKINSRVMEFKLPNPLSSFPELLVTGVTHLERTQSPPFKPVTSGYYEIIKADVVKGEAISVILKTKDKDKTRFNTIKIKFYSSSQDLRQAAKLGEIDGFLSENLFEWETFTSQRLTANGRFVSLYFNTLSSEGSDAELRKTLAADVPRESIIDKILYGSGENYERLYQGTKWYYDDVTILNPAEKDLSDRTLKLAHPNDDVYAGIAWELSAYWNNNYGINFEIEAVSIGDIEEAISVSQEYDAIIIGTEVDRDPDLFAFWHSTQTETGLNIARYSSLRVDTALEEGRNEFDPEERTVHYNVLQETLSNDAPIITLYKPVYYFNYSKRINVPGITNFYTPADQLNFTIIN